MSPPRRAVGLYVHVPFCVSRCAYCTFVASTESALMPRTVAAIARELEAMAGRGPRPLATLYFGGGTPSLLEADQLARLFEAVRRGFAPLPGAEVSLEANPDDITPERAETWRELGGNRVSLGVQAFQDGILSFLNRRHSAAQAEEAARLLLDAGFTVSLDLMLGLPGLSRAELGDNVARVLALRPHHVSVYLLEMDKPHALGRLAGRRPDLFPDEDAAAAQYLAAARLLTAGGYRSYEVSNFALPGFPARHNLRYWRGLPVLAAGPSAHGQSGSRRWANVAELPVYLAAIEAGRTPRAWSRRLDGTERLKEGVMVGLRLARGVPEARVLAAREAAPSFGERLDDFVRLDLARRVRGRVRLTPRGWLVSSELLAELW